MEHALCSNVSTEHALCSTIVTASSYGTCALQQHEKTDVCTTCILSHATSSIRLKLFHVIPQALVVSQHCVNAMLKYVRKCLSPELGHASTVRANKEIVAKRLVDGFSQTHVQSTVRNGSMKQREELSHINVAGKASPQYICVCTNVLLNGTT